MLTAGNLVERALRKILVQGSDVPLEADETQDALAAANSYVSSLEARNIHLGYTPVTTVADFVTVPDGAIDGLIANLAIHMASDFQGSVSDTLVREATLGMRAIRALGRVRMKTSYPTNLPRGSGNWDTYTDQSHYRGDARGSCRLVEGFATSFSALNTPTRILGEWEPFHADIVDVYVSGRIKNTSSNDLSVTASVSLSLTGDGTYTIHLVKNGVSQKSTATALTSTATAVTFEQALTLEASEWLEIWVEADTATNDLTATLGEFRVD